MKVVLNRVPEMTPDMAKLLQVINKLKDDYTQSIIDMSPEDKAQYANNMMRWVHEASPSEREVHVNMRNGDTSTVSNLPGEEYDKARAMRLRPHNLANTLAMLEHNDQMSQYLIDAVNNKYDRGSVAAILQQIYPGLMAKWKQEHTPNSLENMLRSVLRYEQFHKLQKELDEKGMPAELFRGIPFHTQENGQDWWDNAQVDGLKVGEDSKLPLFVTSDPSVAASYSRADKFEREPLRRLGMYNPPTNFGTRILRILTAGLPDSLRVDTSSTIGEIQYGPQFAYGDDIPNDIVKDPVTGHERPRLSLVHYNSDGRLKDIIKPRSHLLNVPRRF